MKKYDGKSLCLSVAALGILLLLVHWPGTSAEDVLAGRFCSGCIGLLGSILVANV